MVLDGKLIIVYEGNDEDEFTLTEESMFEIMVL